MLPEPWTGPGGDSGARGLSELDGWRAACVAGAQRQRGLSELDGWRAACVAGERKAAWRGE